MDSKNKMRKKISYKIILSYTIFIIFLISTVAIFFNNLFRDTHLEMIKGEIREKLNFIDLVLENEISVNRSSSRFRDKLQKISDAIGLRITIINNDGVVTADTSVKDIKSMENHRYRKEISSALNIGYGESIRFSHTLNTNMLYVAKRSGGSILRLAKPLDEIDQALGKLRKVIIVMSLITILASFIIITFLSRMIVRPIERTISFAKRFSEGIYTNRFLNYSEDEIGELQRALNKMADSFLDKITNLIFEQNKLKVTLESISDGIAVIDKDKKLLISNTAFTGYFEYRQNPEQKLYFEVIRSRKLNAKIEESLHNGSEYQFEDILLNGKTFFIHVKPIKGEHALQGVLIVLQDITEKKKIEQIKADLVGNMSHELKTPITIIKGYLETIQENIHNHDICNDFIKKAIENADRQNSLINDILLLNELEASNEFKIEQIQLKEIILNCINLLKPKSSAKGITIESDVNSLSEPVSGNKFLAEEIFFNLIDNAINYNRESGTVTVKAGKFQDRIRIQVEDSGIGIPQESIDRIFERFYRVDKSRSRATGGTGLGLSIVKHAVEILNWIINVESGKSGTVFTIDI